MKIYILSPLAFVSALFCASSAFAFDWKSETGEIVIPADTEAVVTDDDVPDVEKLTKITMGNYASKIKFANDTVPLVLTADVLSGGGAGSGGENGQRCAVAGDDGRLACDVQRGYFA